MKKIISFAFVLLILSSCWNESLISKEEYDKQSKILDEKYYSMFEENKNYKVNWNEYCKDAEKVIKYSEKKELKLAENYNVLKEITWVYYSPKIGNCVFTSKELVYGKNLQEIFHIKYEIEESAGKILFSETCYKSENLNECVTFSKYQEAKLEELLQN